MDNKQPIDKIDIEELLKEFKVLNVDIFATYLKEVWKVYHLYPRIYHKEAMIKIKESIK
jgi:hypothetical protein